MFLIFSGPSNGYPLIRINFKKYKLIIKLIFYITLCCESCDFILKKYIAAYPWHTHNKYPTIKIGEGEAGLTYLENFKLKKSYESYDPIPNLVEL